MAELCFLSGYDFFDYDFHGIAGRDLFVVFLLAMFGNGAGVCKVGEFLAVEYLAVVIRYGQKVGHGS